MCFQAQNMINLSILLEVKNYALFDYIKQYVRCLKDLQTCLLYQILYKDILAVFLKQLNCFYVRSTKRISFRTYSIELSFIVFLNKQSWDSKCNNFLIYSTISSWKFRFNNYFLFFASTNFFSFFTFCISVSPPSSPPDPSLFPHPTLICSLERVRPPLGSKIIPITLLKQDQTPLLILSHA